MVGFLFYRVSIDLKIKKKLAFIRIYFLIYRFGHKYLLLMIN